MARFRYVIAKLDRADLQIQELHRLTSEWVVQNTPTLRHHHDVDSGEHTFWFEDAPEPPAEWGVRVGEVCHNLRSCLDNVVYQLVLSTGVEPPTENRLGFPIFSDAPRYPPRGGKYLIGAPEESIRMIQELQPFNHHERPHGLEVLAGLNDIDKHRAVHPVVTRLRAWELRLRFPDGGDLSVHPPRLPSAIDESYVRYRLHPPESRLEIDPQSQYGVDVAFGEVDRRLVRYADLAALSEEVRRIVGILAATIGETS